VAKVLGRPVTTPSLPWFHRRRRPNIATIASAVFEGRKTGDWHALKF
jgi:hypothetical protein